MKYIDADKLRKRIEKNKYVIEPMFSKGDDSYYEGEDEGYNRILRIIDSLQQEQPQVADASKMEQSEVELEKASRNVYESWKGGTMDDFLRDMVELGKALNARKEE